MRRILPVIIREYMVRLRRRSFIVGALLAPLVLVAGVVLLSKLINSTRVDRKVVVLDQSGDPLLFHTLKSRLEESRPGARYYLSQVIVRKSDDITRIRYEQVKGSEVGVDKNYLVVPSDVLNGAQVEYYTNNVGDLSLSEFRKTIGSVITSRRLDMAGIASEQVDSLTNPSEIKLVTIDKYGVVQRNIPALWPSIIILLFLYFRLVGNSAAVMYGIIEDKQTLVVELIISSIGPIHLLFGKLIGIGLFGLTRFAITALYLIFFVKFGASMIGGEAFGILLSPYTLLLIYGFFFLLGYIQQGALYAIIGSIVSTYEEGQQLSRLLGILNVVPVLTMWVILKEPSGNASVFLSMVPFFAPLLMSLRIPLSSPPAWQVLLSICFMVATISGALWMAKRVYRIGVMVVGKRTGFAEVKRWLRYN